MNKNKNTIVGVVIGLVILAGLIFWSRALETNVVTAVSNSGPTTLVASEPNFDFGALSMAAGKVSHMFDLTNVSSAPVVIKSLYTSCMCTEANLIMGDKKIGPFGMIGMAYNPVINTTVPAGATVAVEAVFDPAAHGPAGIGHIERQINIQIADSQDVVLNFQAQVNP